MLHFEGVLPFHLFIEFEFIHREKKSSIRFFLIILAFLRVLEDGILPGLEVKCRLWSDDWRTILLLLRKQSFVNGLQWCKSCSVSQTGCPLYR